MPHALYIIIKIFRVIFFIILYPIFTLLLIILPLIAGSLLFIATPQNIKDSLDESGIYSYSTDLVLGLMVNDTNLTQDIPVDPATIQYLIDNSIDKEKFAEWLQTQAELSIDNVYLLLKTGTPFTQSFEISPFLQDIVIPTLSNFEDNMIKIDKLPVCTENVDLNNIISLEALDCIPAQLKELSIDDYSSMLDEVPFINGTAEIDNAIPAFSSDKLQIDSESLHIINSTFKIIPYSGLIVYFTLVLIMILISVLLYENFLGTRIAAWTMLFISLMGTILAFGKRFLPLNSLQKDFVNIQIFTDLGSDSKGLSLAFLKLTDSVLTTMAQKTMLIYLALFITSLVVVISVELYIKKRHAYDKF